MEGSAKAEERMRLVRRGGMAVAVACTHPTYLTRIAHGLKKHDNARSHARTNASNALLSWCKS